MSWTDVAQIIFLWLNGAALYAIAHSRGRTAGRRETRALYRAAQKHPSRQPAAAHVRTVRRIPKGDSSGINN